MLISNSDRFAIVANFDPATGTIDEFPKKEVENFDFSQICGHYGSIDNSTLVLYRDAAQLMLRINYQNIVLDETVAVTWSQQKPLSYWRFRTAKFTISTKNDLFEWKYKNWTEVGPAITSYATYGEKLEDFDFGLFIFNVISNPGRKARIYNGPGND